MPYAAPRSSLACSDLDTKGSRDLSDQLLPFLLDKKGENVEPVVAELFCRGLISEESAVEIAVVFRDLFSALRSKDTPAMMRFLHRTRARANQYVLVHWKPGFVSRMLGPSRDTSSPSILGTLVGALFVVSGVLRESNILQSLRLLADNVELNVPLRLAGIQAILKLAGVPLFKGRNWHLIEYIGYKLVRALDPLSGVLKGISNPTTGLGDYAVVEVRIPLTLSLALSLSLKV
jgi:hypothetical protein